jgi:hypothetical protein
MLGDTTMLPAQLCPVCGHLLDSHSAVEDHGKRPEDGDFSVCLACGSVLRYGADLKLSPSSLEEAEDDETRAELAKVVIGIAVLRERNPDWPGNK